MEPPFTTTINFRDITLHCDYYYTPPGHGGDVPEWIESSVEIVKVKAGSVDITDLFDGNDEDLNAAVLAAHEQQEAA